MAIADVALEDAFAAAEIRPQLEAVCSVRNIRTVKAYSRSPENRESFCRRMSERLGIEVIPETTAEAVACEAEIVITASTSEVPVLSGDWLTRPGLVVAAGANHWYKREIDGKVIARASLVVTDDSEQSRSESGNLMWAVGHGLITWNQIEELGNVVAGRIAAPDFRTANIVFGSHGLATTQVAIAQKTYELAMAAGLGTQINI